MENKVRKSSLLSPRCSKRRKQPPPPSPREAGREEECVCVCVFNLRDGGERSCRREQLSFVDIRSERVQDSVFLLWPHPALQRQEGAGAEPEELVVGGGSTAEQTSPRTERLREWVGEGESPALPFFYSSSSSSAVTLPCTCSEEVHWGG